MKSLECDCLVIGSGPGGATTALVLAEAGRKVLVLEQGMDGIGAFSPYSLDEMDNLYRYGGVSLIWGKPKVSYMEACCLGGGSEINAGLYHRPSEELLDYWHKEYNIRDFTPKTLEPFFEMNEKILRPGNEFSAPATGSSIIERGAAALHWKFIKTSSLWDRSEGTPLGQRRSMSRTFIPKARAAGAEFITGAKVEKVRLHSDRAYEAICFYLPEKKKMAVRFKSVFVCAGAIQTPFLLRRSGLRRNIGDRLKLHLSVRLIARFKGPASDPNEGVPVAQVSEFKPQLTLGGSFSGKSYLAFWLAGRKDFAEIMQSVDQMGIFHAYVSVGSHGRIRTGPFLDEALVSMDMREGDWTCLGEAAYKMGQMLFAAGAQVVYSPVQEAPDFRTLAEMEALRDGKKMHTADLSTIHLFSSCPMGEDTSRCALDSFGRVHGCSNVYVHDAGMLPDAPGTNPQALIMALARRNATHWLDHDGKIHG